MDDVYAIAWLASVPGIGPKRFQVLSQLVAHVGEYFHRSRNEMQRLGVPENLIHAILSHKHAHTPDEIAAYCRSHGIKILTKETYSPLLSQIADPPVVLYQMGDFPDSSLPTIAVVGTRKMTPYGRQVTTTLTQELVGNGAVIVSGFMYGVDATAHTTALRFGGKTVGVLGFGFDFMYPREHVTLKDEVLRAGGCLLTEYPPWQRPSAATFPERNRIVSGLSMAVLVTEAAKRSGSHITAQLAVDQGREVCAVPGPIDSPYSEGTKDLLNMGATVVTRVEDIIELFPQANWKVRETLFS